jgi:hypothetical protein
MAWQPPSGRRIAAGADTLHLVLPPGRPEEELTEALEVVAGALTASPAR